MNITDIINALENLIPVINLTDVTNGIDEISKNVNDFINNQISGISDWINGIFSSKATTRIVAAQVSTTYGTGKTLQARLIDEYGNPLSGMAVVVILNGKSFTKTTDINGRISIAIANNLAPKTYTYSLKFEGTINNFTDNSQGYCFKGNS